MEILHEILEFKLIDFNNYELTVSSLLIVLIIFIIVKFLLWLIKKALFNFNKFKTINQGSIIALYQIIKYVIWIIAITIILETIGVSVTVLLTGSAALLVGIGLGLQQTFNDFVSGIILLTEGSIKIGDILEIDGSVIMLQNVGIRTSQGINRDDIIEIIPNSKIISNKVINWSNQSKKTRFNIEIKLSYGVDIDLVTRILEESAKLHPDISDKSLIEARFVDFGNSSLDFKLLFFSENIFRIEKVKSEIRKTINRKFNENNIIIPFPQMDVYLKSK